MGAIDKMKEAILGPEKKEESFTQKEKEDIGKPILVTQVPGEPPKMPEPDDDMGALAGPQEEDEPDRHKDYELEEIAEQFGIPNVHNYVKLYEEDLLSWKVQTDQAAFIKIKALEDQLARMQIFSDKDESEDYTNRAHNHAELIQRFNKLDLHDTETTKEWKKDMREAADSAANMMNVSKHMGEVLNDYLSTLQAYRCALEFYEEARDEILDQLQIDNVKLAKAVNIRAVAAVLNELADAYVPENGP